MDEAPRRESDKEDVAGTPVGFERVVTGPNFKPEETELISNQSQGNRSLEDASAPLVIDGQEIQDDDVEHDPKSSVEESASCAAASQMLQSDANPEELPKPVSIEEVVDSDFI
jgi:hypothetical protein